MARIPNETRLRSIAKERQRLARCSVCGEPVFSDEERKCRVHTSIKAYERELIVFHWSHYGR